MSSPRPPRPVSLSLGHRRVGKWVGEQHSRVRELPGGNPALQPGRCGLVVRSERLGVRPTVRRQLPAEAESRRTHRRHPTAVWTARGGPGGSCRCGRRVARVVRRAPQRRRTLPSVVGQPERPRVWSGPRRDNGTGYRDPRNVETVSFGPRGPNHGNLEEAELGAAPDQRSM